MAYLIEVLVRLAQELEDEVERMGPLDRHAHERRVHALTGQPPPLPHFSAFHRRFRGDPEGRTPEGDIRAAFLLAYEDEGDASVMQLLARPAVFAPETLTIDKLLPTFHHNQTQMLFLVSEYGGVEGIVTLRDVVDELLAEAAPPEPAPLAAAAGETGKSCKACHDVYRKE